MLYLHEANIHPNNINERLPTIILNRRRKKPCLISSLFLKFNRIVFRRIIILNKTYSSKYHKFHVMNVDRICYEVPITHH